jgi:hypothetical protein
MKSAGYVARMGEKRNARWENLKQKGPNGKRVRRREDNIGMDLKNIMD